jgi:hypothetical protein
MSDHFILFIWASVSYKGRSRKKKYTPHKTFTSGDLCGKAGVKLFLKQMFLCAALGVESGKLACPGLRLSQADKW